MSSRRTRSRSPRRRMSAADRRRSEGDYKHYKRVSEAVRESRQTHYSSFRGRNQERGDERHERKEDHSNIREPSPHILPSGVSDRFVDKSGSEHRGSFSDKRTNKDQENHRMLLGNDDGHLTRSVGDFRRRSLSANPGEKNVLFPSGSDTVNRGRDRLRDRVWRGSRGRIKEKDRFVQRQSEGDSIDERGERKRRLFDALVDPCEVPRSGNYFEHDNRDTPQSTQARNVHDNRRLDRKQQGFPNARWSRGRDARDKLSDRLRYRGREWGRERLSGERDRDLRSDWNERRRDGGVVRERGRHRDRSPMHWKHDLFETLDKSPEPEEEQVREKKVPTIWKSGIEDYIDKIDDLSMNSSTEKIEIDL